MTYADQIAKIRKTDAALSRELALLLTLEHVLVWMKCHRLPAMAMSVITQDEFNHDIVVNRRDGSAIAFGVT